MKEQASMLGDIDGDEGVEDAEKVTALKEEELLVGVRDREKKETGTEKEREVVND